MSKHDCLTVAIEITKEAARGGNSDPIILLERIYKKLIELEKDSEKSN